MAIIKGDTAKVQKGDTLSSIAKATGSTVAAIAKANNIADVNLIRPGQLFTIPAKKTGGTPDSAVTETPTVTPVIEPTITKTVVSTYIDPASGDTYSVYSDGSTALLAKGTKVSDDAAEQARLNLQEQRETANIEAQNRASRQSAYDLLFTQFKQYGLESLVTPLQNLII